MGSPPLCFMGGLSMMENVSTGLFCLSMVFALLGGIYGLVRLSTWAIRSLGGEDKNSGE